MGTGPQGERWEKNEGKRVGGKRPESTPQKTLILVPLRFRYSLAAFQDSCLSTVSEVP